MTLELDDTDHHIRGRDGHGMWHARDK